MTRALAIRNGKVEREVERPEIGFPSVNAAGF